MYSLPCRALQSRLTEPVDALLKDLSILPVPGERIWPVPPGGGSFRYILVSPGDELEFAEHPPPLMHGPDTTACHICTLSPIGP